ncbi:MAG: hypothetical protein KDL87_19135, partial [Verrucomicrobiae bacterium]|nr:hypothetical protein [Verrucomicrobiae bacterium]
FGRFAEESKAYVFGLPGNPVSAFVTWHLFVAPAIARWQSGGPVDERLALPGIHGVSKQRLENPGDRPHYLRMRWDEATGSLSPSGMQQSHALFGLSRSEALIRLAPGEVVEVGEAIAGWRL